MRNDGGGQEAVQSSYLLITQYHCDYSERRGIMNRIITRTLIIMLVITMMSASVFAESVGSETVAAGRCGDNAEWALKDDGTLIVYGFGDMDDYYLNWDVRAVPRSDVPWEKYFGDIRKVVIDAGITYVGNNAFWGCESMTELSLADSVETIGYSAFQDNSLEELIIPNGTKCIGDFAFLGSTHLKYAQLPESLEYIGGGAFKNACELKEIHIPQNVNYIGGSAFHEGLERIYFYGDVPETCGDSMYYWWAFPDSATVYFQQGKAGWTSPTWKDDYGFTYNTAVFVSDKEEISNDTEPYLMIDTGYDNGLTANETGGRGMDVNVTSNVAWQAEVVDGSEWIMLSATEGSGNGTFYTVIEPNTGAERVGWLEVSSSECEAISIRVVQKATKALQGEYTDYRLIDGQYADVYLRAYGKNTSVEGRTIYLDENELFQIVVDKSKMAEDLEDGTFQYNYWQILGGGEQEAVKDYVSDEMRRAASAWFYQGGGKLDCVNDHGEPYLQQLSETNDAANRSVVYTVKAMKDGQFPYHLLVYCFPKVSSGRVSSVEGLSVTYTIQINNVVPAECPHANAMPTWDINGQTVFRKDMITETHHSSETPYLMVCQDCGAETGETGYFIAVAEEHDFSKGNVCVCGYDRVGNCVHEFEKYSNVCSRCGFKAWISINPATLHIGDTAELGTNLPKGSYTFTASGALSMHNDGETVYAHSVGEGLFAVCYDGNVVASDTITVEPCVNHKYGEDGKCAVCATEETVDASGQYSFEVDSPYVFDGDLLLMDDKAVSIRVRDINTDTIVSNLAGAGLSIRITQDNSSNFYFNRPNSKICVRDASVSSECYLQLCNNKTGDVIDEILVGVCNPAVTKGWTTEYASVPIVRSDIFEEMVNKHGKYLIIEDTSSSNVMLFNFSVSGKKSDVRDIFPDGYYVVEFDLYSGSPVTYSVSALYADGTLVKDSTVLISNYDRECGIASASVTIVTNFGQAVSTGSLGNLVTEKTHVEMKVPLGGLVVFNTLDTLSIDAGLDMGVQLHGNDADTALFISNCLNMAVRSVDLVKAAKLLVVPQSQFEQFGDGYVISNDVLWYSLNTGNYGIVWEDFFAEVAKAFAKGGELEEIAGRLTGIQGWDSFVDAYCKSMFTWDNAASAIAETMSDVEDAGLSVLSATNPVGLGAFYITNGMDVMVKLEDTITVAKTISNALSGNEDSDAVVRMILFPSY